MNRELQVIRDQTQILGIAEGFFQSAILFALLKLRIFERIGEQQKSLAQLSEEVGAKPETLARLLNAGVVLKLLESDGNGCYQLTPLSRSVLLPTAEYGYLGHWVANLSYFQQALLHLDDTVLQSKPVFTADNHFGDGEQTREFALAMRDYAALRGKELARYLDTTGCQKLLDLGCGHGLYAFQLGVANPSLELYMLDLPAVIEVTRETQKSFGLTNQVQYICADAVQDEIEGEYDIILISNALHVIGPQGSQEIIRRAFRSVKPGGSIVIQAQFLRDDRLGDRWPVLLDLCQLCISESGQNHSVEETTGWLKQAGFSRIEYRRMSLFNTNSFLRGYREQ